MNESKTSCFFCTGKAANYTDYQPCPVCKEKHGTDIPVFCVSDKKTGDLAAITSQDGKNLYPTGAYMTVTQQGIQDAFGVSVEPGGQITLQESEYQKIAEAFKNQQKAQ